MSISCSTSLWLHVTQLGYTLPGGRTLFTDLEFSLYTRPVALVGRNGAGKSVLAQLLSGQLPLLSGRIERQGRIAHVVQRTRRGTGSVAELLGCGAKLEALQRIRAGSCAPTDFECVADDWDLEARLQHWLNRFAIDYLQLHQTAMQLSGGELARLDLIAALLRNPDHLILDEPSNHLDRAARQDLARFIAEWRGGLLLISHDRALLEQMTGIWLLDTLGLHRYGGNYSAFTTARDGEQQTLQRQIAQGKAALRREQQEQRMLFERQQKRLMHGRRAGKAANQSKLLISRQKERSDHGTARLTGEQAARAQRCADDVKLLQQRLEAHEELRFAMASPTPAARCVVEVDGLHFGFTQPMFSEFSLRIMAGERIALCGPNGSGKSTLLRLLTGELAAHSGSANLNVPYALIDQHTTLLDADCSALENFRRLSPGLIESGYRHRLARLGIDAQRSVTPVQMLSGGERLKTALACVLLGPEPKPLLLLDEPTNHLDLDALAALESALRGYRGTLLVISHDTHFLAAIGITREVLLGADN